MHIFRYKADIIPITFFVSLFLGDIIAYFFLENVTLLLVYVFIGILLKSFICSWNHHHQHVETFALPILNRLLEIVYAFQTGIVGYGWVLHHNLGHHLHYMDQSLDESAWRSKEGKRYSAIMYTWIVSITAYYRAWKVGKKYPKIQTYFLLMCALQIYLLFELIAYKPLAGVLIFLLPMITGIIITVYTTYHHHSGRESESPYASSYNIVQPWYNRITGNLGYHTAHHINSGLHWSELPKLHQEIESKIDKRYYKKFKIFWYEMAEV